MFFRVQKAFKLIHIWIWHNLTSNIQLIIDLFLVFSTKEHCVKYCSKAVELVCLKINSGFEKIYWSDLNNKTFILTPMARHSSKTILPESFAISKHFESYVTHSQLLSWLQNFNSRVKSKQIFSVICKF